MNNLVKFTERRLVQIFAFIIYYSFATIELINKPDEDKECGNPSLGFPILAILLFFVIIFRMLAGGYRLIEYGIVLALIFLPFAIMALYR